MSKEIAFLIWLYDKEKEQGGDIYYEALVTEIREKYADMFGLNDELSKVHSG